MLSPAGAHELHAVVVMSARHGHAAPNCTTQQPQPLHHLQDEIVIKVLAATGMALTPALTALSKGTQLSVWPAAEVLQILQATVSPRPDLVRAAALGRADVVQHLLQRGQSTTEHIRTALDRAAQSGRLTVCELLLPVSGLQLSQGQDGETPEQLHTARIQLLSKAASSGQDTVYQWLAGQLSHLVRPQTMLQVVFNNCHKHSDAACSVLLRAHPDISYSHAALLAARSRAWSQCSRLLTAFQEQRAERLTPQDLQHVADILPVAAHCGRPDIVRQVLSLPIGPAPEVRYQALRNAVDRANRLQEPEGLTVVTMLLSDPHHQYPRSLLKEMAATAATARVAMHLHGAAGSKFYSSLFMLRSRFTVVNCCAAFCMWLLVMGNFFLFYFIFVSQRNRGGCLGDGGDWGRFGCWKCSLLLVPLVVSLGVYTIVFSFTRCN